MANAKQCDRCGAFYSNPVTEQHLVISKTTRTMSFTTGGIFNRLTTDLDICPECQAALKRWWDEPINEVDMPEEFKVDTAHLGGDGLSPHYEYAVFERCNVFPRSRTFDNENDAISFMEDLKKDYPKGKFFVRKRLIMVWESIEEEDEDEKS